MIPNNYDTSTAIYRYMDFPELFALLLNRSLYFPNINSLLDINEFTTHEIEKYIPYFMDSDINSINETIQKIISNGDELNNKINKIRDQIYVSCWSGKFDNYALWKIYTKNSKYGFCLESTIGRVEKSLSLDSHLSFHYDKVNYHDPISQRNVEQLKKIIDDGFITKDIIKFSGFKKISQYDYEDEFRFIVHSEDNIKAPGLNVKCDLSRLIGSIHISPFMHDWFRDLILKFEENDYFQVHSKKMEFLEPLLELTKTVFVSSIKEKKP